ncbi:MAG: DUF1778 domain-containing protein [Polyangiaceae bacterium]
MARSNAARADSRRTRGARLGFRVDPKTKHLVERAAEMEHRNVTDYCLGALIEAAGRTIEHHSSIVLSAADRAAFFDALTNPPEPSAHLRRAVKRARTRLQR